MILFLSTALGQTRSRRGLLGHAPHGRKTVPTREPQERTERGTRGQGTWLSMAAESQLIFRLRAFDPGEGVGSSGEDLIDDPGVVAPVQETLVV